MITVLKPSCTQCNRVFSSEQMLNSHKSKTIPCNQVLECKKCNKIFTQLSDLIRHQKRKTPCNPIQGDPTKKAKPNMCIYCRKQLSSNRSLIRHHNTCNIKNNGMNLLFDEVKRIKEENKRQAVEIAHLKQTLPHTINNNITNNNITNNTQNNHFNTTLNFNLINFGEGGDLMKEILAKDGIAILEKKFTDDVPREQQMSDRVIDLVGLVYRNPEYKEMQGVYVLDLSKTKDNAYSHEDGEWRLNDWNPLRQRLLQDLSFQMSNVKGMKLKDVEKMIKLIYALGGKDNGLTASENLMITSVDKLLQFDSIAND